MIFHLTENHGKSKAKQISLTSSLKHLRFFLHKGAIFLILQYRVATGRSKVDYQTEHPHRENEETKEHIKPLHQGIHQASEDNIYLCHH
jgi:hypothetical protein